MPKVEKPATDEPLVKVQGTAAFSKFMHVLQLIADTREPVTTARITALSGYPRPTVHRILSALLAEGLIIENARNGNFELGPRLINLASRSWERFNLRDVALEPLRALRDATRETVHLAVPSDLGMVYVEKLESPQAVRMTSRIGTRVLLHSSSVGKAYLAALDEVQREALLSRIKLEKLTPNTITSLTDLRQEIKEVQQRGYAEDREETESQIFCLGSAILGRDGVPAGCISISIPLFRKSRKVQETYIAPLKATCREISEKIMLLP